MNDVVLVSDAPSDITDVSTLLNLVRRADCDGLDVFSASLQLAEKCSVPGAPEKVRQEAALASSSILAAVHSRAASLRSSARGTRQRQSTPCFQRDPWRSPCNRIRLLW